MSEPSEIYLLLVSHDEDQGATMAYPLHTVTQDPRVPHQVAPTSAWRPAALPHSVGNEHKARACRTGGRTVSERPGRSCSQLVPPLPREAQKCRTAGRECVLNPGQHSHPPVPISVQPTPSTSFRENIQREE